MCTTCGCGEGNLYIEGDERNPHSAFRSAPFAPAPRQTMTITGVKTDHFAPTRTPEGDLHYGHGEAGTHAPGQSQRRMLEVEIDVLDKNNRPGGTQPRTLRSKTAAGAESGFQPRLRQNHPAHRNPHPAERTRRLRGD